MLIVITFKNYKLLVSGSLMTIIVTGVSGS